mmetsp:Transcript_43412/g.131231  ORF Transcript_43412/g.131231 Transcript_43412/m.131231 type:complete len:269 (-) Transcript_43412:72-878(-)
MDSITYVHVLVRMANTMTHWTAFPNRQLSSSSILKSFARQVMPGHSGNQGIEGVAVAWACESTRQQQQRDGGIATEKSVSPSRLPAHTSSVAAPPPVPFTAKEAAPSLHMVMPGSSGGPHSSGGSGKGSPKPPSGAGRSPTFESTALARNGCSATSKVCPIGVMFFRGPGTTRACVTAWLCMSCVQSSGSHDSLSAATVAKISRISSSTPTAASATAGLRCSPCNNKLHKAASSGSSTSKTPSRSPRSTGRSWVKTTVAEGFKPGFNL